MLSVHKIEEREIAGVAVLEAAVFSDAWTEQGIRESASQGQAFVLVAKEEDELFGYCIVYYVLDEAEIARIAVDEKYRGQGVGRMLLDAVTERCRDKGITRLLLDVRESNAGARAFYKAYGFAQDGVRKGFYEAPKEDAVLMSMPTVSTGNARD